MNASAEMPTRRLAQTTLVFAGNLLATAMGFAANVFLMRRLGPEGFGVVIVATTVLSILWQFTGRALDQTLIRFAAEAKATSIQLADDACAAVHRLKWIGGGALCLLGVALSWPATRVFVGADWSIVPVCVGAAGSLAASLFGYTGACLQHNEAYAKYTVLQVTNAAIRLGLTVALLLTHGLTPTTALLATFGGYAGGAALGYLQLSSGQRSLRPATANPLPLVRAARWLVVSSVIYLLYSRLDQLLLSSCRGTREAGVYGAAIAFIQLLDILTGSLLTVYLPRFARDARNSALRRTAWDSFRVAAMLAVPIAPILVLGRPVIDQILGPAYGPTTGIMMIVLPGAVLNALTHALQSVLIVRGRTRALSLLDGATLFVNAAGNLVFIPMGGMYAAAGVALTTRVLASGLLLALVAHELRDPAISLSPRTDECATDRSPDQRGRTSVSSRNTRA